MNSDRESSTNDREKTTFKQSLSYIQICSSQKNNTYHSIFFSDSFVYYFHRVTGTSPIHFLTFINFRIAFGYWRMFIGLSPVYSLYFRQLARVSEAFANIPLDFRQWRESYWRSSEILFHHLISKQSC